ncbi:MAG: hypothetical protein ACLQLT_03375 [Methylovirgula sp.]
MFHFLKRQAVCPRTHRRCMAAKFGVTWPMMRCFTALSLSHLSSSVHGGAELKLNPLRPTQPIAWLASDLIQI